MHLTSHRRGYDIYQL